MFDFKLRTLSIIQNKETSILSVIRPLSFIKLPIKKKGLSCY